MRNLMSFLSILSFGCFMIIALASCEDTTVNPDGNGNTQPNIGQTSFEVTDGPIDDASVQSAFVTIAAIRVDGQTYDGFSGKQTIDLLAYQNGDTKAFGLADLEVGTYSNVSLVLDYDADVNGDTPGCYILTTDGAKHELSAAAMRTKELVLDGMFTVEENTQTDVVIDFDLRKAIAYTQNSGQSEFQFVTDAELEGAIRMMTKAETGEIEGQATEENPTLDYGDKIIVYAYQKGTFDAQAEAQGQGESQIEFLNAETSAVVDAAGGFTLAFLEEGDYELHFISYEDTDNDGSFEIKGEIQLTTSLNVNLNEVSVEAGASLSLDIMMTGVLPIL